MPWFRIEVYADMLIEAETGAEALEEARKESPGWQVRILGPEK